MINRKRNGTDSHQYALAIGAILSAAWSSWVLFRLIMRSADLHGAGAAFGAFACAIGVAASAGASVVMSFLGDNSSPKTARIQMALASVVSVLSCLMLLLWRPIGMALASGEFSFLAQESTYRLIIQIASLGSALLFESMAFRNLSAAATGGPARRAERKHEVENPTATWTCPKCGQGNPNSTFTCGRCDYTVA